MRSSIQRLAALLCPLVLFPAAPAFGQVQVVAGFISGTVADSSGAVIPNVTSLGGEYA